MKSRLFTIISILLLISSCKNANGISKNKEKKPKHNSHNFETTPVGQLPRDWVIEATRKKGSLATWKVIKDSTAPSGQKVLALTKINSFSPRTFNLCRTKSVNFLNGELSVKFKALTGKEDQGGGIMWRVKDKNNYYVARFNPLEDNFRLYTVHKGVRRQLASAKISLPKGKWHNMKIVAQGNTFDGYLNGKKLLHVKSSLFKKGGNVGLWTKADAVTSFDNFVIKGK